MAASPMAAIKPIIKPGDQDLMYQITPTIAGPLGPFPEEEQAGKAADKVNIREALESGSAIDILRLFDQNVDLASIEAQMRDDHSGLISRQALASKLQQEAVQWVIDSESEDSTAEKKGLLSRSKELADAAVAAASGAGLPCPLAAYGDQLTEHAPQKERHRIRIRTIEHSDGDCAALGVTITNSDVHQRRLRIFRSVLSSFAGAANLDIDKIEAVDFRINGANEAPVFSVKNTRHTEEFYWQGVSGNAGTQAGMPSFLAELNVGAGDQLIITHDSETTVVAGHLPVLVRHLTANAHPYGCSALIQDSYDKLSKALKMASPPTSPLPLQPLGATADGSLAPRQRRPPSNPGFVPFDASMSGFAAADDSEGEDGHGSYASYGDADDDSDADDADDADDAAPSRRAACAPPAKPQGPSLPAPPTIPLAGPAAPSHASAVLPQTQAVAAGAKPKAQATPGTKPSVPLAPLTTRPQPAAAYAEGFPDAEHVEDEQAGIEQGDEAGGAEGSRGGASAQGVPRCAAGVDGLTVEDRENALRRLRTMHEAEAAALAAEEAELCRQRQALAEEEADLCRRRKALKTRAAEEEGALLLCQLHQRQEELAAAKAEPAKRAAKAAAALEKAKRDAEEAAAAAAAAAAEALAAEEMRESLFAAMAEAEAAAAASKAAAEQAEAERVRLAAAAERADVARHLAAQDEDEARSLREQVRELEERLEQLAGNAGASGSGGGGEKRPRDDDNDFKGKGKRARDI